MITNGDVNRDGMITADDATMMQKAGLDFIELTEEQARYADLDGDGIASSQDGALCLRIIDNYCANTAVNAVQPVETVLVGDVNGDGSIDATDAAMVNAVLMENLAADQINLIAADANGDKVINQDDAAIILKHSSNISVDGSIVGQYRQDVDNSEYTIEYTETETTE